MFNRGFRSQIYNSNHLQSNLFRLVALLELGVLELHSGLARELGTAVGEGGGLVRLLRVQLALVVGQWQWTTVLDQLQQLRGLVLAQHASRAAAEWSQLPGLAGLNGGATGRSEAHSGEIWKMRKMGKGSIWGVGLVWFEKFQVQSTAELKIIANVLCGNRVFSSSEGPLLLLLSIYSREG